MRHHSESSKYIIISLIILYFITPSVSACVVVNEVYPRDPEWVEIYNPCNMTISLSEWHISDNQSADDITCHTIANCSLETNATYFLIIDRGTNITDVTDETIPYFFVGNERIGRGLNNDGMENVTFYNSSYASSMTYSGSADGKSWSHCPSGWIKTENVTPGSDNYCPESETNSTNTTDDNTTADDPIDFGDSILMVDEPTESVRFGDFTNIRAYLYTGDSNLPLRIVTYIYRPRWVSNDLDGKTIYSHLNETKTALVLEDIRKGENITLLLPLFIKSNCDGDYSEGVYTGNVRVYEDGTDKVVEEEKFNITIQGNNPIFCNDCPKCQECKETTCSSSSAGCFQFLNFNNPLLIFTVYGPVAQFG